MKINCDLLSVNTIRTLSIDAVQKALLSAKMKSARVPVKAVLTPRFSQSVPVKTSRSGYRNPTILRNAMPFGLRFRLPGPSWVRASPVVGSPQFEDPSDVVFVEWNRESKYSRRADQPLMMHSLERR
jgi:hypothetical protein